MCAVQALAAVVVTMTAVEGNAKMDTSGLILLLHLDEAAPPLRDTAEEDYAVTVNGAELGRPGVIGKACAFDGQDDYVKVDAMLCYPQQTIMLWARPNARKTTGGILSSQAQPGQSHWRWRISRNADKTASFHLWDGNMQPEPTRTAQSTSPLPDGEWSHLAVTIDTTHVQAVLFVNGKPEATAKVTSHSPFGLLFVGTATTEEYFAGEVDEVAVFERVLSPDEIARHVATRSPLPDVPMFTSDAFVLRPVGDRAWFTFRHRKFGRRRWMHRMPEYMYTDPKTKRGRTPHDVRWEVSEDRTHLKLRCGLPDEKKKELGLDFRGEVVAHEDSIDYTLVVTNVGQTRWTRQHMLLFCLQSGTAEGFLDYEAKRTYVHREGRWVTMHEVVKGTFAEHRMCGVGVGKGAGKVSRLAARVSEDGRSVLGLATDIAASLSFNFQNRIACMHSNPSWGLLEPGQQAAAKGKIYLFEGTLDDLWKRYRADFPDE